MRRSTSTTLNNNNHNVPEPLIKITITPSKPFFYAGELFEATITLTNVRKPASLGGFGHGGGTRRTSIDARDRVRPPISESPGSKNNSSGVNRIPARGELKTTREGLPKRLGLIGRQDSIDKDNQTVEDDLKINSTDPELASSSASRKPYLAGRNQSVDLDPISVDSIPRCSSPPTNIPSSHPHARQTSVSTTLPFSPTQLVFSDDGLGSPPGPSTPTKNGHLPAIEEISAGLSHEPNGEASAHTDEGEATIRPRLDRHGSSSSEASGTSRSLFGFSRLSFDANTPRHGLPPSHRHSSSFSRSAVPLRLQTALPDNGDLTILWAQTRLVGRFTPSSSYIPPDPLLPLKSLMLHQPVGSGSLPSFSPSGSAGGGPTSPSASPSLSRSSSRWNLSFGTGTLDGTGDPTLTGSLWGLAKGLIGSGQGGTLEQERKRVWNSRELPVLETMRSLVGVEMGLEAGQSRAFTYTLQLPEALAPTFRGKAMKFGYELSLALNINFGGDRQKTHELLMPIKVFPTIDITGRPGVYDVLSPIVHKTDLGKVHDKPDGSIQALSKNRRDDQAQALANLLQFAENLSTGTVGASVEGQGDNADAELRDASLDDTIARHVRSSKPAHFDIHKHGEPVAEIDLIRTAYRAGETIVGVVEMNHPGWRLQVMKVSATLHTDEIIPESLLPPSPTHGEAKVPLLRRTIAGDSNGFTGDVQRLTFELVIPNETTPTMSVIAGPEGRHGGLGWSIQVHFLIRKQWARHHRTSSQHHESVDSPRIRHIDRDVERTEVVHCTMPIVIYPGGRTKSPTPQTFEVNAF